MKQNQKTLKTSKAAALLLVLLTVTLPTLQKVKLDNSAYKPLIQLRQTEMKGHQLNFSEGKWVSFTEETSDGRIMEYHPTRDSLFEYTAMSALTSMAYYQKNNFVIAFYKKSNPMPRYTIHQFYEHTDTRKQVVADMETWLADPETADLLNYVNNVPAFKMYEIFQPKPLEFYHYWETLRKQLDSNYIQLPYTDGYQFDDDDLKAFYRKMVRYFTFISLFPTELDQGEDGIEGVYESFEVDRDERFEQDLDHPMDAHTEIQDPFHRLEEFQKATQLLVTVTRRYLMRAFYYSPLAMRYASATPTDNITKLILENLLKEDSLLVSRFNFSQIDIEYDFPDAKEDEENPKFYKIIFYHLVNVYKSGQNSYQNFVQHRKVQGDNKIFPLLELKNKDSKKVMMKIFQFFKETVMPKIVNEVVATFFDQLSASEIFTNAGLNKVFQSDPSSYKEFSVLMKMFGYMQLLPDDENMITWHSHKIFTND